MSKTTKKPTPMTTETLPTLSPEKAREKVSEMMETKKASHLKVLTEFAECLVKNPTWAVDRFGDYAVEATSALKVISEVDTMLQGPKTLGQIREELVRSVINKARGTSLSSSATTNHLLAAETSYRAQLSEIIGTYYELTLPA